MAKGKAETTQGNVKAHTKALPKKVAVRATLLF
jgi:hypothetical protein